jgi:hypothetical protein
MSETDATVEQEEDPVSATESEGNGVVQESSVIDRLREQRKKIGEQRSLDLDIPGYDGVLVARYNRLEWDDLKKIGKKADDSRHPRKELMSHCDVLIKACEQIMIRKDGLLEPITNAYPEVGEEPVRYDARLAVILDIELKERQGARTVVIAAFGGNEVAVTAQQTELVEWVQSSNTADDEDFSNS